jgi:UPF0755 protein
MKRYLSFLIIGLVLVVTYLSYTIFSDTKINQSFFVIESGSNLRQIANNLEEKEIINSADIFYYYGILKKADRNIIAGYYKSPEEADLSDILELITNKQPNAEMHFTIQEGLTIEEIDQKLADESLISPGQFIQAVQNFSNWDKYSFLDQENMSKLALPLEGYIYPDTYFLSPFDFKPEELIEKSLDNFANKIKDTGLQYKNYSSREILIMASIVEKEVFGYTNRQKVAGIFWKRLENNWTLGADITTVYETKSRVITQQHLNSDSPYNTRKNLGLPPGPVTNPSLESIKAVMNPIETNYWFYLTTLDTGEVIYAVTNEEHNLNRFKFLQ